MGPSHLVQSVLLAGAITALALSLQGCAGIGLTLLGVGAGTGAGVGVNHTLGGIAYKTFTAPAEEVHAATRSALNQMAIPVTRDETEEPRMRVMAAKANDREIDITIESVTPRTTRLRVVASEDVVFKDSATATEIIMQTAQALDTLQAGKSRAVARAANAKSHTR